MSDLPTPLPPSETEMATRRRSFLRLMLFIGFVFVCTIVTQAYRTYRLANDGIGDGKTVASYGFDLSNLSVDPQYLESAGTIKNAHATLVEPQSFSIEQVDSANESNRAKGRWTRIVVPSDTVIGVSINGESRAYPIRYLQWHEIINDTLGGEPICVTFQPPCASAMVFSRPFGDEIREFRFSGLVYMSNLVMYDQNEDLTQESLWSQMLAAPIAGKALERGETLNVLPMYIGSWEKWRELQPTTSVFGGVMERKGYYKRDDFERYYKAQKLWNFKLPSHVLQLDSAEQFTPMRGTRTDAGWQVRTYWPQQRADAPMDAPAIFALRYAWEAFYADSMLRVQGDVDETPPPNTEADPIF